MAGSVWALLAQAAVDSLNGQVFDIPCLASRRWQTNLKVESTEKASIQVVPATKTTTNLSRGGKQNVVQLGIVVLRQFPGETEEDDPVFRQDQLAALAQAIEDFLSATANSLTVADAVSGENWSATPIGDVQSEIVQEWLDDAIFAVRMTISYILFR